MRLDPPSTESRPALAEGQRCGLTRPLGSERVGSIFEFPQWVDSCPSLERGRTTRLRRYGPFLLRPRRLHLKTKWRRFLNAKWRTLAGSLTWRAAGPLSHPTIVRFGVVSPGLPDISNVTGRLTDTPCEGR